EALAGRVPAVPPSPLHDARVGAVPRPSLAAGTVRYVGEPVAAVLAESPAAAVDAAALVEVDYEPLPVVSDARAAFAGNVLLHEALGNNVLVRMTRGRGDVDASFKAAAHVDKGRFHIPRVVPAPMEPRGAVAAYDRGADLLTLWCSAQDPYRARAQLRRALGRCEAP